MNDMRRDMMIKTEKVQKRRLGTHLVAMKCNTWIICVSKDRFSKINCRYLLDKQLTQWVLVLPIATIALPGANRSGSVVSYVSWSLKWTRTGWTVMLWVLSGWRSPIIYATAALRVDRLGTVDCNLSEKKVDIIFMYTLIAMGNTDLFDWLHFHRCFRSTNCLLND